MEDCRHRYTSKYKGNNIKMQTEPGATFLKTLLVETLYQLLQVPMEKA